MRPGCGLYDLRLFLIEEQLQSSCLPQHNQLILNV